MTLMTIRLCLILALMWPVSVSAAPCLDASRILTGETSPCDGILVPESKLLKIRQDLNLCYLNVEECEISRQAAVDELAVQTEGFTAANLLCEQKVTALEQAALAALDPPEIPWFEHPAFVASISILLTIAASAGVYALADHLARE